MIGVVGDYNQENPTHRATTEALRAITDQWAFEWISTDQLRARWSEVERLSGLLVAPASPYRDMAAVLDVIRHARERGIPLVGT
jgi:CTP synthase (UTP-ammonia lyase)